MLKQKWCIFPGISASSENCRGSRTHILSDFGSKINQFENEVLRPISNCFSRWCRTFVIRNARQYRKINADFGRSNGCHRQFLRIFYGRQLSRLRFQMKLFSRIKLKHLLGPPQSTGYINGFLWYNLHCNGAFRCWGTSTYHGKWARRHLDVRILGYY